MGTMGKGGVGDGRRCAAGGGVGDALLLREGENGDRLGYGGLGVGE